MATPHDVAKYILHKSVPMTAMKLLKLIFYAQAWSLVWNDEPLFDDEIEAWANGPVVPAIYRETKGKGMLDDWVLGSMENLSEEQKAVIDKVLKFYGPMSSNVLSSLTHDEEPWLEVRGDLGRGRKSRKVITKESLKTFYSTL